MFLDEILRPLGGGEDLRLARLPHAWVDLPGVGRVTPVPGGSHWGGGVFISAVDQCTIGQMLLDGGTGGGRQLVPREWIARMFAPCPVAPFYGRLLWLNRSGKAFPGASTSAAVMQGAGGHYVWIDPDLGAVVVLRWLDMAHGSEAVRRIAEALAGEA